jgi:hypothetical protein
MSTTAVEPPSGAASNPTSPLPIPTIPAGATQSPDSSSFNLEPFTGIIRYFTTSGLGMPENNAWEMLTIFGIVMLGLISYIKVKNFFVAFAVVLVLSCIGYGLHLVQGYMIVAELIVAAGVWAIDKAMQ